MDIVQQEDLSDKGRDFFQELIREIEIKNAIAQKVLNNRLAIVGNSDEKAKVNLQHKEYQKESFRLLRFCRRMTEKKDKEAGYIEFDQPEGVPDVKPITEKELDQKLREALIEPQQIKPVRSNTIPPHYSREMSRYEPSIPVKEKEKEKALEKVREMTNGGSKGSKSKKQVEGETDLSWDHEGLKPHSYPGVLNLPRSLDQGQRMNKPLLEYALSVEEIMMKKNVLSSYLRKKKRRLYLPNWKNKASKQIRVRQKLRKNGIL